MILKTGPHETKDMKSTAPLRVDSSEVTDYGGGSTVVRRHSHHGRFFDRLSHKYMFRSLSL
jgi:hypothetical protein